MPMILRTVSRNIVFTPARLASCSKMRITSAILSAREMKMTTPAKVASKKAKTGFCSLMTRMRKVAIKPRPTTWMISKGIAPSSRLEKEDIFDRLEQILHHRGHHKQNHDKPDQRHPLGVIFLAHLLEDRMHHGDDDPDSGDLKDSVHVERHR